MFDRRKRSWTLRAVFAAALVLPGANVAHADIIKVPDDQPTIQQAIDAAEDAGPARGLGRVRRMMRPGRPGSQREGR